MLHLFFRYQPRVKAIAINNPAYIRNLSAQPHRSINSRGVSVASHAEKGSIIKPIQGIGFVNKA